MNNAVIYNRVSTLGQNKYNGSVSLQAQESVCSKYAHANGLSVKRIYKEIHSAYNKIPNVLNSVINLPNMSIIVSSVDRFSRSVSIGIDMATRAIKNQTQLIFVQEKFTCKTIADLKVLKPFLEKTEEESNVMSVRITKSKSFLSDEGYFIGGRVPYGFKLENKVLVEHESEQNIINFILTCKNKNVSSVDLNAGMSKISNLEIVTPIECYDAKDNVIEKLTKGLYNAEIATLLNSYGVKKRGLQWTSGSVSFASRANQRHGKSSKPIQKLIKLPTASLGSLGDCGAPKKVSGYRKRSSDSIESDSSELSCNSTKKSRVVRINNLSNALDKFSISETPFSPHESLIPTQVLPDAAKSTDAAINIIRTCTRSNNIRVNINEHEDYKLFEQFKLFKKFQNLKFGEPH